MKSAAALLVALLAVTSCGGDNVTSPPSREAPVTDGWQTVIDPETDAKFRCFMQWRKVGYAGGLAMFCYEP